MSENFSAKMWIPKKCLGTRFPGSIFNESISVYIFNKILICLRSTFRFRNVSY
jgi:hypothetical protein